MKVTVIDYGMGNIFSIKSALQYLGCEFVITNNKEVIEQAESLILPGVGAFKDAMHELIALDLVDVIKKKAKEGTPLLGICLGMQLLLENSEEFGFFNGLNLIPGNVCKFPKPGGNKTFKIPQISWNTLSIKRPEKDSKDIFESLNTEGEYMYFIHSYYANNVQDKHVYSVTVYNGFEYCSAIRNKNVYGVQFHPEKSGEKGLEILKKFITINKSHEY